MNKGFCIVTFVLGAAIGSFATWKWLDAKYEKIVQEEIDSVKELYCYKKTEQDKPEKDEGEPIDITRRSANKPSFNAQDVMTALLNDNGYKSGPEKLENRGQPIFPGHQDEGKRYYTSDDEGAMYIDPYVISPDEFGEDEEYEKINLTYYSDGVLADENDEVVDDVDAKVGIDSLDTFGRFEEDSVHVKNDYLKCYYEILRDERTYEDIMAEKPHPSDFYE